MAPVVLDDNSVATLHALVQRCYDLVPHGSHCTTSIVNESHSPRADCLPIFGCPLMAAIGGAEIRKDAGGRELDFGMQ